MQLLGGPTCGGCTATRFQPRSKGSPMFRRLRVLAAFLLVPLVVFSNPSTASAATTGIESFRLDGGIEGSANCQVAWARVATGLSIGAASRCDAGADLTPYSCQAYEGTCGMYGLVVKDSSGSTCGSASLPPRDVEGNDVRSVAAGLGPAFVPLGWTDCVPASMCLSYYFDPFGFGKVDDAACSDISVDAPAPPWAPPVEMPWGDCKHGYPFGVSFRHKTTYESTLNPPTTMYKDKWRVGFENRPQPPLNAGGGEWLLKAAHNPEGSIAPTTHPTDTDGTNPPSSNPQWVNKDLWINDPVALSGSHNKTDGEVWGVQITTKDPALSSANIPIGYTNPGKCTFWFGPKIRTGEHPTYGDDDPWDGLILEDEIVETPDEEPPPVQVPTNPPDFGLPDIGSFLQGIGEALKGIVRAIGKLFKDLLIPSDGFLDDAFSDLSDAWKGTTIVQFLDVFDGFDVGEVNGCAGVRMQFEMPGASNYVIDERLGAACDGPMAQTASIVRAVVTAVVFVTGGMACVRGIGAGFGWRPSFGRVDDA